MPTEEHFVSHIDFGDGVVRTIKDPNASGTAVVGVKGDAEESYRHGNVNITKANIGLGNVENLKQVSATENQGLTDTEKGYARDNLGLGTAAIKDIPASGDASNTEVVLGSDSRLSDARQASDVYSWAKASTKPSYTPAEVGAVDVAMVGVAGGIAELDSLGKVPASQLPSYVDDVLEYADLSSFPATGESGKIYVAQDTNKTYRWSGSSYVVISETLALGETDSTAYRGDRGKTAYDHSQSTHARTDATNVAASTTNGNIKINGTETTVYTHPGSGTNPHGTTKSDVGLGNVGNFKAVSTVASQGLSDTEKSNARANIGAGTSSLAIGTTASTAAAGNHTHSTSIAASSGTNQLTLAANTKYAITAGGTSYIFTTPPDTNTWRPVGTGATDAAAGNHTHGLSIAADSGTNQLTLAASTKYKITAGGSTYIFTTPPNSTYNFGGTTFYSGNSSTAEHNANNAVKNGNYYYTSNGPSTDIGASTTDGALYVQSHSDTWVGQIAQDYRNGNIFVRGKNNGTWQAWKKPDAGTLQGAAPAETATGSTIVKRNSSGYIYAAYYNQSSGAETPTTSSYMIYCNSDGWFRKSSLANVKTILGLGSAAYTASTAYAAASHTHAYAPTSHASTATTYGVGNASNYGHVKLSDTYDSNVGAAANAIGASQTALHTVYYRMANQGFLERAASAITKHASVSGVVTCRNDIYGIQGFITLQFHTSADIANNTTMLKFANWTEAPVVAQHPYFCCGWSAGANISSSLQLNVNSSNQIEIISAGTFKKGDWWAFTIPVAIAPHS